MSWGRGFGSARFDHFFQDRAERFGLLEVNVVACAGNSLARDRVVGIRAKVGKDLAVLRIKPPRQIANWDTAPRKLAKRANRLAPQRHLVGTRLFKRERERFRVVGKATRPKTFSLVNWKIALAFEKRQGFPPGHESEHSFAPHARGPREVRSRASSRAASSETGPGALSKSTRAEKGTAADIRAAFAVTSRWQAPATSRRRARSHGAKAAELLSEMRLSSPPSRRSSAARHAA